MEVDQSDTKNTLPLVLHLDPDDEHYEHEVADMMDEIEPIRNSVCEMRDGIDSLKKEHKKRKDECWRRYRNSIRVMEEKYNEQMKTRRYAISESQSQIRSIKESYSIQDHKEVDRECWYVTIESSVYHRLECKRLSGRYVMRLNDRLERLLSEAYDRDLRACNLCCTDNNRMDTE